MFHVYSTIFTSYILDYTYRGIFAHIQAYFSRFRHIQDSCITGPNNVKQHLLFKPDCSFKSLPTSTQNIFFIFVSKVDIQHFAFQDSISVIAITIIIICHPHQHSNHASHASMPSTQTHHPPYPRYTRWPATHASMSPTPPTLTMLARFPRKYATHASTLPTASKVVRVARHF